METTMRKIDVEELKKLQLDILCDVNDFCKKNNITYFLSCGTLIGAIRHKGFIPWDDDIDIEMPRKDYDRFFQFYGTEMYKAVNFDKDHDWPYAMGKVYDIRTSMKEKYAYYDDLGVNIDVFPIDGLPNNNMFCKIHLRIISMLRTLLYTLKIPKQFKGTTYLRNVCGKIIRLLIKPIPIRFFSSLQDKLFRWYSFDKSSRVASLATDWERKPFDKSWCSYTIEKEFEGYLFPVTCGYDAWLRNVYGDYMQLPPVSERVTHHNFEAFWKDEI